jgi:predicted outer membrane protein
LALSAAAQAPDVDLWFIDNTTAHHQGAVDMAREALTKAKHPELKTFARQIIKDQTTEIGQMKWRVALYKGASSVKSENPGMQMKHGARRGRRDAAPEAAEVQLR